MTVTESCLILRWLCLSIRDVFISFLIFILIVIILLLILKDFFLFLFFFYTVFTSPLPPLLEQRCFVWALDGDFKKKKKKINIFCNKGYAMSSFILHQKKTTKTFLSHSQPCWLFFLKTLTESLLVCFYFFALTDLIKLLIKWILCPRREWLVCFEMVLLT